MSVLFRGLIIGLSEADGKRFLLLDKLSHKTYKEIGFRMLIVLHVIKDQTRYDSLISVESRAEMLHHICNNHRFPCTWQSSAKEYLLSFGFKPF